MIKPPAAGGDPQLVAELTDRLRSTKASAARSRVAVEEMRTRLATQGQVLHADLTSSLEQANTIIAQAEEAMSEGQWSVAEDMLQRASYQLRRLGQSLGQ